MSAKFDGPFWVYVASASDTGEVVYVGIAKDLKRRERDHQRGSPWAAPICAARRRTLRASRLSSPSRQRPAPWALCRTSRACGRLDRNVD